MNFISEIQLAELREKHAFSLIISAGIMEAVFICSLSLTSAVMQ